MSLNWFWTWEWMRKVLLFATTPKIYLTNPFQHRSYVLCSLIFSILSPECLYGPVSECSSDCLRASLCIYLYNRKYVWVLGPSSRWSSRGINLGMCRGERKREWRGIPCTWLWGPPSHSYHSDSCPSPLKAGSTSKDCLILFLSLSFYSGDEYFSLPVCVLVVIISETLSLLAQRSFAYCLQIREILICHRQIIILEKFILCFMIVI